MDWVTKWVTTAGPCGVRRRTSMDLSTEVNGAIGHVMAVPDYPRNE